MALLLQPLSADDTPKQHPVASEVHDNAVPSLVNLTSLPSALVNGCVNVIIQVTLSKITITTLCPVQTLKIVTRYTYSDDGYNLKTSECDPLGNYTYYEYYPHSNLLKAKLICDQSSIKKREFFAYV